jgi:hypothetical protein
MTLSDRIVGVIIEDFLIPTIDRLSDQLKRNIHLNVELKIDGAITHKEIAAKSRSDYDELAGVVRIVASDTAVPDRYKYRLQCIFLEQNGLEEFSGIRMNGAVRLHGHSGENDYDGFSYTYNSRDWGKQFRDF